MMGSPDTSTLRDAAPGLYIHVAGVGWVPVTDVMSGAIYPRLSLLSGGMWGLHVHEVPAAPPAPHVTDVCWHDAAIDVDWETNAP